MFRNYHIIFPRWIKVFWLTLSLLFGSFSFVQAAQNVTLAWDPSPDSTVTGYQLQYGTSSGIYTTTIDVGNSTTATVSNLTSGTTYFFVVTAYNAASLISPPSNEASFTFMVPTVGIDIPNGSSFNGPSQITLSAAALEVGGSIARVDFFNGSTLIGQATGAPYSVLWNNAPPGNYVITAVAYDATGKLVSSTPVAVTVMQPAISGMQRLHDGSFQLTLTGAAGKNNTIYVSSDLQTWTPLITAMNTTGTLVVDDPGAANADHRFYRMTAE
jgi:Fibronectin type III domain/Bacterial Ig domain